MNTSTGELSEARLDHKEQAEQFYHELSKRGLPVRVGMEANGHARWFERLLNELQFELWIGDAAAVRTKWYESRRSIARMRSCCWKTAFRESGYRMRRIAIGGNYCGIPTGWCRCARAS